MIFQHTWQQVLDGSKTQTRRLVKRHEIMDDDGNVCITGNTTDLPRIKWQVGRTYAVQPGRGKKAVARYKLLDIRCERLQDITPEDAIAEGVDVWCYACGGAGESVIFEDGRPWQVACSECNGGCIVADPVEAFRELWNSIHKTPGTRWDENPRVWVLEFELCGPRISEPIPAILEKPIERPPLYVEE